MSSAATQVDPRRHLFTRDEYYRMGDEGFFEGKRVELIEGEIFEMSPQKSRHTTGVQLVFRAASAAAPPNCHVRLQFPLALGPRSEPEPDAALVEGVVRDYVDEHPRTALLIVEVAESSLDYDLGVKASLYARAGIADYWVVDLVHDRVVVHRRPGESGYDDVSAHARGEALTPLAEGSSPIAVNDLLP